MNTQSYRDMFKLPPVPAPSISKGNEPMKFTPEFQEALLTVILPNEESLCQPPKSPESP